MYKLKLKKNWLFIVLILILLLVYWLEINHYGTGSIVVALLAVFFFSVLLPVIAMVVLLREDLDQSENINTYKPLESFKDS